MDHHVLQLCQSVKIWRGAHNIECDILVVGQTCRELVRASITARLIILEVKAQFLAENVYGSEQQVC